jgi:hypothetical protein
MARRVAGRPIAMQDPARIRKRSAAGLRVCTRLYHRVFRSMSEFVAYRAAAFGIAMVFTGPLDTSKACSQRGRIGSRTTHRFVCGCCRRAHSDVKAALDHARLGETALAPRADIKRPYVEETGNHVGLWQYRTSNGGGRASRSSGMVYVWRSQPATRTLAK